MGRHAVVVAKLACSRFDDLPRMTDRNRPIRPFPTFEEKLDAGDRPIPEPFPNMVLQGRSKRRVQGGSPGAHSSRIDARSALQLAARDRYGRRGLTIPPHVLQANRQELVNAESGVDSEEEKQAVAAHRQG